MTQLRHCKCGNSNYFDRVLSGIGHRGSSFSDLDAISHDHVTQRFLLQEFKREGEKREKAQHWMLRDFIRTCQKLPAHFTAWMVERQNDERFVGWAIYGQALTIITVQEYQQRFQAWWNNVPFEPPTAEIERLESEAIRADALTHAPVSRQLDVDEIDWG